MSNSKELQTAINIVKEVNKRLLAKFNRDGIENVRLKADKSLLTDTDLEINEFISSELKKVFPDDSIVNEEIDDTTGTNKRIWYVDPIDGTSNFARGFPRFGTSIGMIEDGDPKLGVIGLPHMQEIYAAEEGKGATRNGKKINTGIRGKKPLVIVCLCNNEAKDQIAKLLPQIDMADYSIQILQSAVLHLSAVAAGNAAATIMTDAFPWDLAAGAAIVEEAGGIVTNHEGGKWSVNDKILVASAPECHEQMIELTKKMI